MEQENQIEVRYAVRLLSMSALQFIPRRPPQTLQRVLDFLYILTLREIKGRYKGSILGPLWVVVYPCVLTGITTIVFSQFLQVGLGGVTYALYALTGITMWNFFSKSLSLGTRSLNNNRELIVETAVEAKVIPASYILGQWLDIVLGLVCVLGLAIVSQQQISFLGLIVAPIVYLCLSLFVYGLALFLSAINVLYKDTQNLLDPVLLIWFYVTPVLYSLNQLPEAARKVISINPITVYLDIYRAALFVGKLPSLEQVLYLLLTTFLSLLLGWVVFRRYRPLFADVI